MALPTSWHDINVCEMIEISHTGSSLKDVTKLLNLFIDVNDVEMDVFMDAAVELSSVLSKAPEIVPCLNFELNGSVYRMRAIEEFSVSEYIDFDEFKDKPVDNLPTLLAIIYESDKDTGDYVEDVKRKAKELLELPADIASSAMLFFSKSFLNYTNSFLGSLAKEKPELKKEVEKIQSLLGTTLSFENPDGISQTDEPSMG